MRHHLTLELTDSASSLIRVVSCLPRTLHEPQRDENEAAGRCRYRRGGRSPADVAVGPEGEPHPSPDGRRGGEREDEHVDEADAAEKPCDALAAGACLTVSSPGCPSGARRTGVPGIG